MAVGPIQGAATSAFSIAGLVGSMFGKGVSDIKSARTAEQQRMKLIDQLKITHDEMLEAGIMTGEGSRTREFLDSLQKYIDDPSEAPQFDFYHVTDEMAQKYDLPTRKEVEDTFYNFRTQAEAVGYEAGAEEEFYKAKERYQGEIQDLTDKYNKAQEELNVSKSREFRGFNKYADMANNHLVEAQKQKSIQNQMKARNIR